MVTGGVRCDANNENIETIGNISLRPLSTHQLTMTNKAPVLLRIFEMLSMAGEHYKATQ